MHIQALEWARGGGNNADLSCRGWEEMLRECRLQRWSGQEEAENMHIQALEWARGGVERTQI